MEEELEINEEQNEEIVEDVVDSDDTVSSTNVTDEVLPLDTTAYESSYAASEDTTSYVGDEESTTSESNEESSDDESSEDKWGSIDCRSECKYNTGDRYKYANYGYSD